MFERIFVCGDIHGRYDPIERFYNKYKDTINFSRETDCIIFLGDVGFNYYGGRRDDKFKTKMSSFPFTYFCIRGNHEMRPSSVIVKNPAEWRMEPFFGDYVYVERDFPYIKYAMDVPAVYNIPYLENTVAPFHDNLTEQDGYIPAQKLSFYKTLVLPGAYSVDKYYRLQNGWAWFKDEQMSEKEMVLADSLIAENHYNFDIILSHTCPINYEPTDLFLSQINQSTVDKTMERYLGEIESKIDYKLHLFAHFHNFRIYPKNNDKQTIMLFNKEVFNIIEYFKTLNPYQCLY